MKNVFDPHNNYDEWEENDWEFEEYINSTRGEKQPEGKNDWKLVLIVFFICCVVIPVASCVACP